MTELSFLGELIL